ncbi:MAG: DUF3228 family protein [Myxococcota bacterium]|nr:DUF3228 family protein [Myxococcota bacterium]
MTSIDWTKFALDRHREGSGHSWYSGDRGQLVQSVHAGWHKREPGFGRSNLDEVVVVPMAPERFHGTTVTIRDELPLTAEVARRRPHEDPYVRVTAATAPDPVRFAAVVLYSRALLLPEEPDFAADWGIVSITASAVADEPMHPLTMARNMLEKPGGTKAVYTAEQFAEAVYYWSRRVGVTSS